MNRTAERISENEIPVDVRRSRERSLRKLDVAMLAKDAHRLLVERDRSPRAGRLRRAEADAAARRDELLLDTETLAVEVERAPGEPEEFAAAHPRRRGQAPERKETIVVDVLRKRESSFAVHASTRVRAAAGGSALSAGLRTSLPQRTASRSAR